MEERSKSVKALLKWEQSLIAWPLNEALAISLPLAWRGSAVAPRIIQARACDEELVFREISKGLVHCLVSR